MPAIYLDDLLDERGSIDVKRVEWKQTQNGLEARMNGSVLSARVHPSNAPTPTWSAYIGDDFTGYQADNERDVMGYLLRRAAFER